MITAVLDSNAYDVLAATEDRLEGVLKAVADRRAALITVHHVRTEVAKTPDSAKRERMLRLLTDDTPAGFLIGYSTLGGPDVLVGDEEGAAYQAVHTTDWHHVVDGQVLGVAVRHGATVVTNDKRLTRKAQGQGVTVLTPEGLLELLGIP